MDLAEATEVGFEPRVVPATDSGDLDGSHFLSRPEPMTAEKLEAWLAEMASLSLGDSLPANGSRADIYDKDEPR